MVVGSSLTCVPRVYRALDLLGHLSGDFELLLSAIPSGDLDLLGPRSGDSELLLQFASVCQKIAICGLERSSILDVSESSTACSAPLFSKQPA